MKNLFLAENFTQKNLKNDQISKPEINFRKHCKYSFYRHPSSWSVKINPHRVSGVVFVNQKIFHQESLLSSAKRYYYRCCIKVQWSLRYFGHGVYPVAFQIQMEEAVLLMTCRVQNVLIRRDRYSLYHTDVRGKYTLRNNFL